jgi:hypothetical protein
MSNWDDNADGIILTFVVSRGLFGVVRKFLKLRHSEGLGIMWREVRRGLRSRAFQVKGKHDDVAAIAKRLKPLPSPPSSRRS